MKPEDALQCACWTYAQQVLPPDADYASIETKIGHNDRIGGMFRKMKGIRAGEPDARVIYRGRYTGIEFKAGASVSDAQHRRHAEIRRAGGEVYVVRSVVELREVFVLLGIELRHHSFTPEMRDEALAARQGKPAKPRRKSAPRASSRALLFAAEAQKP